jgi:leukotriene-A4 hydrolase
MSATRNDDPISKENGITMFDFEQTVKIPSYLIAIAVGDILYRRVGPRTGILAEPTVIDAAYSDYNDL